MFHLRMVIWSTGNVMLGHIGMLEDAPVADNLKILMDMDHQIVISKRSMDNAFINILCCPSHF